MHLKTTAGATDKVSDIQVATKSQEGCDHSSRSSRSGYNEALYLAMIKHYM